MGAVSVSSRTYRNGGANYQVDGALALSSSYATNGDTITAAQFGLATIDHLMLNPAQGYSFEPDLTNLKIKCMGATAEAGNGTPLNGITVRYSAVGV